MRPILTTLLFLVCIATHAQQPTISKDHLQVLRSLMSAHNNSYAPLAKTTQVAERVIGQSIYNNFSLTGHSFSATFLLDSFSYQYSNGRGSHFDYYQLLYPEQFFDAAITNVTDPVDPRSLTADARPLSELADTITRYKSITYASEQLWITYDQKNKVTAITDSVYGSGQPDTRVYWFHYNTDQTLSDVWNLYWDNQPGNANGITKVIYSKEYYTYQNGRHIADSLVYTYLSNSGAPTLYSYDANGNVSAIVVYQNNNNTLAVKAKYINTYTLQDQLMTVNYYVADTTSFVLSSSDSFAYTSANTMPTIWDHINYGSNGVGIRQGRRYHWSHGGLVDTVYFYSNDTALIGTTTVTYDTSNYPTEVQTYSGDKQTYAAYFYYEPYVPISVPAIAKAQDLHIFPNPATNVINIAHIAPGDHNVHVTVLNVQGQVVLTQTISKGATAANIAVAALTPGTYTLLIVDEHGNIIGRDRIAKM